MATPLVLDCLEMAFWSRRQEGVATSTGLTRHTDAGSVGVYTSIAFTDRLIDEGIDPSVGSVGDAYDNAMAEWLSAMKPAGLGELFARSTVRPHISMLSKPKLIESIRRMYFCDKWKEDHRWREISMYCVPSSEPPCEPPG
jgi:transposase InsO family protein